MVIRRGCRPEVVCYVKSCVCVSALLLCLLCLSKACLFQGFLGNAVWILLFAIFLLFKNYHYSLLFFRDSPGTHNSVAINRDMKSSRIFPLQVNPGKYGNLHQGIFHIWWRSGIEGITELADISHLTLKASFAFPFSFCLLSSLVP